MGSRGSGCMDAYWLRGCSDGGGHDSVAVIFAGWILATALVMLASLGIMEIIL